MPLTLSELTSHLERLDDGLAARRRGKPPPASTADDAAPLVSLLTAALSAALETDAPLRDPPIIATSLHCLASLAAYGGAALAACNASDALLALAGAAAAPPADDEHPLPPTVQHLALMLLLNLSVAEAGARRVGRAYSPLLEQLHKGSDDPRSRSLAGSVLENVAQNAPWLQQLVQQPRGKLQQVSPAAMLATFAQLEAGIAAGDGPPCAPGNRRLPPALARRHAART